jgi:hypothetical protein
VDGGVGGAAIATNLDHSTPLGKPVSKPQRFVGVVIVCVCVYVCVCVCVCECVSEDSLFQSMPPLTRIQSQA